MLDELEKAKWCQIEVICVGHPTLLVSRYLLTLLACLVVVGIEMGFGRVSGQIRCAYIAVDDGELVAASTGVGNVSKLRTQ